MMGQRGGGGEGKIQCYSITGYCTSTSPYGYESSKRISPCHAVTCKPLCAGHVPGLVAHVQWQAQHLTQHCRLQSLGLPTVLRRVQGGSAFESACAPGISVGGRQVSMQMHAEAVPGS